MFITCTGSRPLPTSQLIYKFHANMFLSLPPGALPLVLQLSSAANSGEDQAFSTSSSGCSFFVAVSWMEGLRRGMLGPRTRCAPPPGSLVTMQKDGGWEKKRSVTIGGYCCRPFHFCIVDSNQTLITSLLSPLGPSENKLFFRCYIKLAHTRS